MAKYLLISLLTNYLSPMEYAEFEDWKLNNPLKFIEIKEMIERDEPLSKIARETRLGILLINQLKDYINSIKA